MNDSDLLAIITQGLESMKDDGYDISPGKINLTELKRRTGFSRSRLRRFRDNNWQAVLHGNTGKIPANAGAMTGYEGTVDTLLKKGVTNSSVIFSKISKDGFTGSVSTVKRYIASHMALVPAKREIVQPNGNRGRRYTTGPGEMFQMDWGFVNVVDSLGQEWKCACFAMVCHHCGYRYIEFFPSATQENLFIGMLHAFIVMGVPKTVLTDNMASVSNRRDCTGQPIFNENYNMFQKAVGFATKLCKVAHPFTKGKVERLVLYMKGNFIQGKTFLNVNDLNRQAYDWCCEKNAEMVSGTGLVPNKIHNTEPLFALDKDNPELLPYYAPLRKISYDGYVTYESRRYGVPIKYRASKVRVLREYEKLSIIDPDTGVLIVEHSVDWSRLPHNCEGQWEEIDPDMPQEQPTAPVKVGIRIEDRNSDNRLSRFNF